MMEIFTRAILDCLGEEIVLLNEGIEEDAILSSIKNFIPEECDEFREDASRNERVKSGDQNNGDSSNLTMIRRGNENRKFPTIELAETEEEKLDGEGSYCLAARKQRTKQGVPNLIVFEPKRLRRNSYCVESQTRGKTSMAEWKNGYLSMANMGSCKMKAAAKNKNDLKLHRWMKRGKRGLLTLTKIRPSDRRLRSGLAEF